MNGVYPTNMEDDGDDIIEEDILDLEECPSGRHYYNPTNGMCPQCEDDADQLLDQMKDDFYDK